MYKPAEMMKLMTALIMDGCFENRRYKSKGKLRDIHKLNS